MVTRVHVRRWMAWIGVGVGVLGVLGYIFSFIGPMSCTWAGDRHIVAGRGGIGIHWLASGPRDWAPGFTPGVDTVHWVWRPSHYISDNLGTNRIGRDLGRVIVPYWVFLLIGAGGAYCLLPRGYPRGCCPRCGYDMKGVKEQGGVMRCPECGTTQGSRA